MKQCSDLKEVEKKELSPSFVHIFLFLLLLSAFICTIAYIIGLIRDIQL